MFSSRVLAYSLNSGVRAVAFVAILVLAAIVLIAQTTRMAVAEHFGTSTNLENVRRAVHLDPVNPKYQYRLGLLQEFDWQHMDVAEAVGHLKAATALQPNNADYWSSLGRACFTVGNDGCAEQSYETSVRLAPSTPRFQWDIANYYLLAGKQDESFSHFHRFLELSPDDPTPVFNICQRIVSDPQSIWHKVVPASDTKLRMAYINFLNEGGHPDAAFQYWNEIARDGSKAPYSTVQPYLDGLIARNHIDHASKVWRDLETLGAVQTPSRSPENVLFNGSFERDPLNSGFDWRTAPEEYISLDFSDRDCPNSKRCLRVDFPVANNAEYEPIYEIVPVEPNRHYELTADARSSEISSDSGPRLRVVDPQCPTCVSAESQASIGTTPWHKIAVDFSTGPKTQEVHVSLWRPRGRSFPMEIQGTFWLASVSLTTVSATPASAPEAPQGSQLQ